MNMRKIYLWIFLLIFLLNFNISFVRIGSVFAQATSSGSQQAVNYELPYPGLLPDSPLYFLRVTRDRIVGLLISDPLIKAEFNLLQADKRLNAGIYLFNKKKIGLAYTTVSKAENYFGEAIDRVKEAKREGRDVNKIEEKLNKALKKHAEEIKKLSQREGNNFKASFEKELKRTTDFEQRLN